MRSKEQFINEREKVSNHADRKRIQYLLESGCDQETIEHISGENIKRWK